ncbi:MAG: CinA family protein [Eubacterium sp.]|nr:CinA family protein [Eubacterium sp.]
MDNFTDLRLAIDKTAKDVVQLLVKENKKLSTAESCTGGLISAAVTAVSGSSSVFDLGICTYANSAKEKYLGVPAQVLKEHGAVSETTARLMAAGIRAAAASDIGVSVTGIAGPTGGTPDKPVGTVYVGISTADGDYAFLAYTDASEIPEQNRREYIRLKTVLAALNAVKDKI